MRARGAYLSILTSIVAYFVIYCLEKPLEREREREPLLNKNQAKQLNKTTSNHHMYRKLQEIHKNHLNNGMEVEQLEIKSP